MSRIRKSSLFGTDGIRSQVGDFPLDKDSIIKLGNALGGLLEGKKIVIGRDTRQSGQEIEQLIASGIGNRAEVYLCGVIPTPAISYITDHSHFDYGIMITASHNPYTDNGIKIFNTQGEKISRHQEQHLEDLFFSINKPHPQNPILKPINSKDREIYKDYLIKQASGLEGKKFKLVLDCANGATYQAAPEVFQAAGFEIQAIHTNPDGQNINQHSGSTNPQRLKQHVIASRADLGIAFDGDGDRAIFVDRIGNILDGDHSLYAIARYLLDTNPGFNKIVVGTVVGNLGLERILAGMGVQYLRAQVRDKHVYQEMKKHGAILGGEQSGHTILKTLQRTGDGILTAIYFLKALFYLDLKPEDIFKQLIRYPQVTRNIEIRRKKDLHTWKELNEMIAEFNNKYGLSSRVLVRYSGTEPKIRIMLESEHDSIIGKNLEKFENLIQSTIGA